MLFRADLALEDDVSDVEAVAQEIGERTSSEGNAANRPPISERADFGDDAALTKVDNEWPDLGRGSAGRSSGPARPLPLRTKSFLSRLT
jgi:hypothetical protein